MPVIHSPGDRANARILARALRFSLCSVPMAVRSALDVLGGAPNMLSTQPYIVTRCAAADNNSGNNCSAATLLRGAVDASELR